MLQSLAHVELLRGKQVTAAYHISALPKEQFDNRCVTRGSSQVDGPISQLAHSILHASNLPLHVPGHSLVLHKGEGGGPNRGRVFAWRDTAQASLGRSSQMQKAQRLARTVAEADSNA